MRTSFSSSRLAVVSLAASAVVLGCTASSSSGNGPGAPGGAGATSDGGGSSSGSSGGSNGSASPDGGKATPACVPTGFATSGASFAIPSLGAGLGMTSSSFSACSTTGSMSDQSWSTFDVTGDGKPDLVLTASCTDTTVGTTQWLVYENTGSGFATSATSFAIPSLTMGLGVPSNQFNVCPGNASSSEQNWTTFDVTGDGKPDLVVTESCTDATAGTDHWLVYANTGSGFAATATSFAVPVLTMHIGVPTAQFDVCPGNGSTSGQSWSTFDVTGDGKPDLVVTESCTDATAGTDHWVVYANTGSGFAATATSFAIPKLTMSLGTPSDQFQTCPGGNANANGGALEQNWTTLDVTGDGKPDLVVTESCSDATAGTDHWLVYANTGGGFAASATSFALPKLPVTLGVPSDDTATCPGGSSTAVTQSWSTLDVTDDGKPDLIVTRSCADATVGVSRWLVYANDGSGFAASPAAFALPSLPVELYQPSADFVSCAAGTDQSWTALDLTGDGTLDLVVTHSCSDGTVGTSEWTVFPEACAH